MVGTQWLIPIQFIDRTGVYWTAKSEQTLVAPEARGQNVFKGMYDFVFRHSEKNGIRVIWGYTQARKAFERIGFAIPATSRDELVSNISAGALSSPASLINPRHLGGVVLRGLEAWRGRARRRLVRQSVAALDIDLRPWDHVPKGVATLSEQFVRQWGGATIFRDEAFLTWRLMGNPFVPVRLIGAYQVGYVAFAINRAQSFGSLVDVVCATPDADEELNEHIVARLLLAAIHEMEVAHVQKCHSWSVNEHPFDSIVSSVLLNMGFRRQDKPSNVVLFPSPAYSGSDFRDPDCKFDDYSSWYVSLLFMQGHRG